MMIRQLFWVIWSFDHTVALGVKSTILAISNLHCYSLVFTSFECVFFLSFFLENYEKGQQRCLLALHVNAFSVNWSLLTTLLYCFISITASLCICIIWYSFDVCNIRCVSFVVAVVVVVVVVIIGCCLLFIVRTSTIIGRLSGYQQQFYSF